MRLQRFPRRIASLIFCACCLSGLLWPAPVGAQQPAGGAFTMPFSIAAEKRYEQAVAAGAQQYARDLDAALKAAMLASNLNEANAINAAKKQIATGDLVTPDFQTVPANSAKARFIQSRTLAKQQYLRDLDAALKAAMVATNLDEANAINAARQRLAEELKPAAAPAAPGAAAAIAAVATPRPAVTFGGLISPPSKPGLEVKEYAIQDAQNNKNSWYCDPALFVKPLKTYSVKSIYDWPFDKARNAIASGYLVVEKDGEYSFNSNSGYDRNMLKLNGEIVCKFGDGEATISKVVLKKGFVPIESIGYNQGGNVKVKWKPPGQEELTEIPTKFLKH